MLLWLSGLPAHSRGYRSDQAPTAVLSVTVVAYLVC